MPEVTRVVGIGSSAGGLEALTLTLGSIPADLPFCYVIAQHTAPDYESPLAELLSRHTGLTVHTATDGARLAPGTALVAPSGVDITVVDGHIRLTPPSGTGPHPRIDVLLNSLVADHGPRAVAIVLSGSGADGASGAKRVHQAGGVVIAQDPQTAAFPEMPQSAIDSDCTDLVLAADHIGAALGSLPDAMTENSEQSAATIMGSPDLEPQADTDTDSLLDVVKELRRLTGIDFSDYKQGTLDRQISRRMTLTGMADLPQYRNLLLSDPQEVRSLTSALLVGVTGFFRDPDAWAALAARLRQTWPADVGREYRIWVPGCSTGEEAYTIAMVAAEVLGTPARPSEHLKIFATDLSEQALATARRGWYDDDAVAAIPEHLRKRWWHPQGNGWEVAPGLRDAVVFARHNVTNDPPFPRLDLISIRNTLIYFQGLLQSQALRMFRYSLLPGGLLFLGNAERVDDDNTFFKAIDSEHRIYARTDHETSDGLPALTGTTGVAPRTHNPVTDRVGSSVLASLLPPTLVVDGNDDVVEVVGDVGQWCWVAPGAPSAHLVALLRDEYRNKVRMLLLRIRHGEDTAAEAHLTDIDSPVTIRAQHLGDAHPGWVVITFHRLPAPTTPVETPDETAIPVDVLAVARELESTQAALQATVEDLSASNEELRALNEELQASSEEAQSANEELQATNEELSTLNQELRIRTGARTGEPRPEEHPGQRLRRAHPGRSRPVRYPFHAASGAGFRADRR